MSARGRCPRCGNEMAYKAIPTHTATKCRGWIEKMPQPRNRVAILSTAPIGSLLASTQPLPVLIRNMENV